jgi:hypothetical protein
MKGEQGSEQKARGEGRAGSREGREGRGEKGREKE